MTPAPRDDFGERLNFLEHAVNQIKHELATLKEHQNKIIYSLDRIEEIVTRIARLEERLDGMMKMHGALQSLLFAVLTALIAAALRYVGK